MLDISRGSYDNAKNVFGHADYYYHKDQGMTSQELLDWVNGNMSKFSAGPKNQPGGGGLYDMMVKDADQEKMMAASKAQFEQEKALIQQSQEASAQQFADLTNSLANPPYSPNYMASNMSIGNSGNATGVRARLPKSTSNGTYSLNRRKMRTQSPSQTMQSPLSSLIGLKIK